MITSLVIVESPAKAKTINRYLGKDYKVLASYGHVRDLLPKNGAVEPDNNFEMHYQTIEKNVQAVNNIKKSLKQAKTLYLATDPDREGEAIAWHLYELLKEQGALKGKQSHRIVFHEVTKHAVLDAFAHPKELSNDLINAQQARRALDYLVGFNLSPLLWKKIQRGLSAGRVQSPALRMIVQREEEIEQFKAREYWTLEAILKKQTEFTAKLTHLQGEKLRQFSLTQAQAATQAQQALLAAVDGHLTVSKVEKKQRKRQPAAPFITSTLQQESVRKLGLTAAHTMRLAQQLYEGIDIGGHEGSVGLITYMRTDSVALAQEAQDDIKQYIIERYGKNAVPIVPRVFKTKSKNAQEAHEAIRPTSIRHTPDELKSSLDRNQLRLYELIWKRTLASQMVHATINTVAVDLACGERTGVFRANGSTVANLGFMAVYEESSDNQQAGHREKILPPLQEGERVPLLEIKPEQHFTEPPPRYTEASLVKTLEEYGIGRPSTYASIIHTLKQREYVEIEKKHFVPTEVGRVVNRFLTEHFETYVNYDFTARLEDELDAVSRGEKSWLPLMKQFWGAFKQRIDEKEKAVSRGEAIQARELGHDPETGAVVSVRIGRYGPYAQIGTKDDEEKPKFASLRPDQKLDSMTLEEALALFELPRVLGKTEKGEEVVVGIGRFGPYIRYGDKFVSLKEDDPYTVDLDRALALVAAKKAEDAKKQINRFEEAGISVLDGRYGPYVTDGKKNVRVPKDRDAATLTLVECQQMIVNAPERRRDKKKTSQKKRSQE